jgi:acetyl esterase/lipase
VGIVVRRHRRLARSILALSVAGLAIGFVAAAREWRREPPSPSAHDVPYGSHGRHRLDVWLADATAFPGPRPLLVFIHGGGFVLGDKHEIDGRMVRWALDAGISVAALNYRSAERYPFPAPMHDAARALQFLRSKAPVWNLDPARVAAYGGSAGAGIALWLAFHDDLADPSSPDPVARQSTRLKAVGDWAGQTTYDPTAIRAWLGGHAWEHSSLLKLFGLTSIAQVDEPGPHHAAFAEASPLTHLTPDDPPVYLFYNEPDSTPLPDHWRPGRGIHHPEFGHRLAARMTDLGIECVETYDPDPSTGNASRPMFEFLARQLAW